MYTNIVVLPCSMHKEQNIVCIKWKQEWFEYKILSIVIKFQTGGFTTFLHYIIWNSNRSFVKRKHFLHIILDESAKSNIKSIPLTRFNSHSLTLISSSNTIMPKHKCCSQLISLILCIKVSIQNWILFIKALYIIILDAFAIELERIL